MKRLILIVVFFATLFLASGVAAASQYRLSHPTREHCRRSYVRHTTTVRVRGRRVQQVWCVHHAAHHAAPKQAPAGSLSWLLAHISVAQSSEVLAREAAPTFAVWGSKRRDEQGRWVQTAPECATGSTSSGSGYINCEEKGELTYVTQQTRSFPCSNEPWESCSEPYNVTQAEKYRAILEVSAAEGSGLCGNLTFQHFLGSQWEYAEASRATCNVRL